MSDEDYTLLINICHQALKTYGLTPQQTQDIARMMKVLDNLRNKEHKVAVPRNKKMGKIGRAHV